MWASSSSGLWTTPDLGGEDCKPWGLRPVCSPKGVSDINQFLSTGCLDRVTGRGQAKKRYLQRLRPTCGPSLQRWLLTAHEIHLEDHTRFYFFAKWNKSNM